MRTARLIVSLALLVALFGALSGTGTPPEKPAANASQGRRTSVMSFNIRFGTAEDDENHWCERRDFCIDVIDQYGRDFVGLQEALRFQIDEIRATLPRFAETGVGRSDGKRGGEYSPILYDRARWSLDPAQHGTFWLSETPEEIASTSWGNTIPRIVTWGRFIEKDNDRAVWVYNTHFDHQSQRSRERSAMLLARRIAARAGPDEPVIVTGDFNMGEDNPVIEYLKGETALHDEPSPIALVDSFRAAHPDTRQVGTFSGFAFGRTDGEKIDYVFVDQAAMVHEAAIVRAARGQRYPSDHFPVTATVSWD